MHRGYIALWRKIEDHPFWKERRPFSKAEAWVDLLMQAQHKEGAERVVLGLKTLECHYGESLKSIRTWADRWKWSNSRVVRYLNLLQKMEQIRYINETVTTRITILNYKQYDPRYQDCGTEAERKRNGSGTEAEQDNNDKNGKNNQIDSKESIVGKDADTPTKHSLCPQQKIKNIWNETLPECPQTKVWGTTSQKHLQARWKESPERQSIEWWRSLFLYAKKSTFLMGDNDKGWKVSLGWLVKPSNMEKLLNGNYHRSNSAMRAKYGEKGLRSMENLTAWLKEKQNEEA